MILVLLGSTYTRSVVPKLGGATLGGARSYDKGGTARQCTYSQPIFIGMHRNFKREKRSNEPKISAAPPGGSIQRALSLSLSLVTAVVTVMRVRLRLC